MTNYLGALLSTYGISEQWLALSLSLLGSFILFTVALISYYITKHYVLVLIQRWVLNTRNSLDDLLLEHSVFSRISALAPIVLVFILTPSFINNDTVLQAILIILAKVAICFQTARCISALLNVIKSSCLDKAQEKYLPLNATIQVLKLSVYSVATILAIALIVDRSPLYLLSGLGALTAVLLLVFQDTIKGLVASIQISANRMVAPGDWIEMPSYGADGDVVEIGLSTVKVRNFDNTITTVPTYALISHSFKNWRGMLESQGRRIKRSIVIDTNSISFYSKEQLSALHDVDLLKEYLVKKSEEINNSLKVTSSENSANQRKLTNIGTFRAYIEHYVSSHPMIHSQMTCMVRQLAPTTSGVPLELYCFSKEQNWKQYEMIQADIFDHIFAIAPLFELRIFQHPTGHDWLHTP